MRHYFLFKLGPKPRRKLLPKKEETKAAPAIPSLTKEQWAQVRRTAPAKLPLAQRPAGPAYLLKQLRVAEMQRVAKQYPRDFDAFRAGDKVAVTQRLSLHQDRLETVNGMVVWVRGKGGFDSSFSILTLNLDEKFQLIWPLWSPFLAKVTLLEKGPYSRRKLNFILDQPREFYEVTNTRAQDAGKRGKVLLGLPRPVKIKLGAGSQLQPPTPVQKLRLLGEG